MGDMADYYDEREEPFDTRPQPEEGEWITADGECIKVTKMEPMHLRNTIRYLQRNHDGSEWAEDWIDVFQDELDRRRSESS
ncbi:MAG: hypothetical protein AAF292_16290 [Pseudomonadota bacterium]